MYLSTEEKNKIFEKYGKGSTDTGSAEGQIALFTYRIKHLTGHLKKNNNKQKNLLIIYSSYN
jgi:small subunit ribosomal protein S15